MQILCVNDNQSHKILVYSHICRLDAVVNKLSKHISVIRSSHTKNISYKSVCKSPTKEYMWRRLKQ